MALLSEVMSRLRGVKRPLVQFISVSGYSETNDVVSSFVRASATQLGRTLLIRLAPQSEVSAVADAAISRTEPNARQAGSSADMFRIVPDSIVPALYHAVISSNLGDVAQLDQDWWDAAFEKRALDFRLVVVEGAAPENCPATLDLAARCHATILLVHAGRTTPSHLGSVIRQIQRVSGTLLGTVLHDAPSRPRFAGLQRPRRHLAKSFN